MKPFHSNRILTAGWQARLLIVSIASVLLLGSYHFQHQFLPAIPADEKTDQILPAVSQSDNGPLRVSEKTVPATEVVRPVKKWSQKPVKALAAGPWANQPAQTAQPDSLERQVSVKQTLEKPTADKLRQAAQTNPTEGELEQELYLDR